MFEYSEDGTPSRDCSSSSGESTFKDGSASEGPKLLTIIRFVRRHRVGSGQEPSIDVAELKLDLQ